MSRRMWILAVGSWVAVVLAGSALTWLAINRAGQQVTGSSSATQAPVVGTVGPPPVSPTTTAPSNPSPATSSPPSQPPSAGAGPTSAPPSSGGHSTSGATSRPSSAPTKRPGASTTKPPTAAPGTQTRTWSGPPGFVTVSCTGVQATRTGASPSNGWSLEAGDASGDSIEVTFRSGEEEVKVQATCVGGAPSFHVETSGGADD